MGEYLNACLWLVLVERKLIIGYLEKFPKPSRADIDDLLKDKLSDALNEEQKLNKIANLITSMRRAGEIRNTGSRKAPRWGLVRPAMQDKAE